MRVKETKGTFYFCVCVFFFSAAQVLVFKRKDDGNASSFMLPDISRTNLTIWSDVTDAVTIPSIEALSHKGLEKNFCHEFLLILCYVMLCYVMLCYAMLCYVTLRYVILCYVMLFNRH